jgi:hypothetical protein
LLALVVAALHDHRDVAFAALADFHVLAVAGLDDGGGVVGARLIRNGPVARAHLSRTGDVVVTALACFGVQAQAILSGWHKGRFEIHFPLRFTLSVKLLAMLPFRLYQAAVRRITGL